MKAIQLKAPGGPDQLQLVELDDPGQPGRGEIRVRIHASSLNFHDYLVVAGKIPNDDKRIPMADAAGVVEAVGEGVEEFKTGDRVISCFFPWWQEGGPVEGFARGVPGDGMDGYAREVAVTPATWFTHAPTGYSHSEAATLPTAGLTAWRALVVDGGIKAGDTVLVMGTGGVSICALQMARAMGAQVIATSSSEEKMQRLKAMGAAHVLNYRTEQNWGEQVREATGGRGVDIVVEIGGPGSLPQSIKAVRVGGHIALIGVLTGMAGDVPTAELMYRQARIQGITVGSRRHQLDMVRALESIEMRPVIDRSFTLGEIAVAFRHQESGKHFGKICLEY
ncbi:NAD(P)-dependent alcohol dehydrogenase [Pseudomonas sp. OIL-1]|uniref:zinc-dependent alcohol dehydrogenase family protein n=1 Tax=Pseudomonas sp. OIL-1 TaxID=2706126 RepID=UPI0013A75363|nr:NAD(P)-dependent alcohol dehydrogenase [Pseudomonas sp. OIL-1]QIB49867.1 NAD(P)-dependent alcohol dehydrogenase [Pseudomonas sp. OIL-1]